MAAPRLCAALVIAIATTGCGARSIRLPTDAGLPFPEFAAVHASLTGTCRSVRTLTAELALSGRVGGERIRGRVLAGFERPDSMRLEGVAPFGPPAFILAARGSRATLLLPRNDQVVRGASAREVLGALTGVALAPPDLQAILTGCVTSTSEALAGHLHGRDWASIDVRDGARLFLRRQGSRWQLRAARRDGWEIEYPDWGASFPATIHLRSEDPRAQVTLTAALSQVETNIDVDAAAFTVDVPAGADTLTIDDLRRAGPLRGQ